MTKKKNTKNLKRNKIFLTAAEILIGGSGLTIGGVLSSSGLSSSSEFH